MSLLKILLILLQKQEVSFDIDVSWVLYCPLWYATQWILTSGGSSEGHKRHAHSPSQKSIRKIE